MNNQQYTYAVARIRANEIKLLTKADYDSLINASGKQAVASILIDKGWDIDLKNISSSLENEAEKVWDLFTRSVPDINLIDALIIPNDFYNLKAAIKATFSDLDPSKYYISPCTVNPALLTEAVSHNNFKELPDFIKVTAEKAYDNYAETSGGQDSEIIIDKASLETALCFAEKSKSELLKMIMSLKCVQANIKTALRCIFCGKSKAFTMDAFCTCPGIDNERLYESAKDKESLSLYLSETPYSYLKDAVKGSFTQFENFCDDYIIGLTDSSKWLIDGPDPVISYYYIKMNEIKNARVIFSAKENGLTPENIREKVRGVYV
ncbi:MAG: V-type ATPase subunit [Clostridia bacterium]|nr:V-type ATPase subunit [Clostridia bacterium]